MRRQALVVITTALLLAAVAIAQRDTLEGPKRPGPSVSLVSTGPVAISKTKPTKFSLTFRVAPGYHVNSHTPKSENLIPTSLKLDPPQDIAVGKFVYPPGQDFAFEFSPDEKLSVYQNDFTVGATATTTANVDSGTFKMRGELTYQACDNRQCYPPKKAPVEFDIKVQKTARKGRRSPGQSPHTH
jgi:DsbC/DsbD-like thiol-disulfide interchange protein